MTPLYTRYRPTTCAVQQKRNHVKIDEILNSQLKPLLYATSTVIHKNCNQAVRFKQTKNNNNHVKATT